MDKPPGGSVTALDRLVQYFQGIADSFEDAKKASAIFPNCVDAGSTREDVLAAFLHRHVPTRCTVARGGFIFDSCGNESRQIDLMITNDITLQFRHFEDAGGAGKSFNCIEGCIVAISVKSYLGRSHLYDALTNLLSIPPTPDLTDRLVPSLRHHKAFKNLPIRIIFGFHGPSARTVARNTISYLSQSEAGGHDRCSDLILVNNKYVLDHAGEEGLQKRDGTFIEPYSLHHIAPRQAGAYALVSLLARIQSAAHYGTHLLLDFNGYIDTMSFR